MTYNEIFPISIPNGYIKAIVEKMLDEILDVDNRGNAVINKEIIPSFDNLKEEFDDLDSKDYITALSHTRLFPDEFKIYDSYLQLSDNYTLDNIDTDLSDDYNYQAYILSVENACDEFADRTGQELSLLGRSGRHICVEYNLENLLNYNYFKGVQQELEQKVIDEVNEISKEENISSRDDEER